MQILTPDLSGRSPPLPPPSLPPHLISLISLSSLSHLSLISFSSLSSLSPLSLSLSPLCLSYFRLSSLSSLAGGSGQRATYKGLFTPASKKSAVFFPTSLPSTFPFWSASFRPPPWPQVASFQSPGVINSVPGETTWYFPALLSVAHQEPWAKSSYDAMLSPVVSHGSSDKFGIESSHMAWYILDRWQSQEPFYVMLCSSHKWAHGQRTASAS